MALVTTDIAICNTALLYVGADEITDFDEERREAKLCNQIYEVAKQGMLQKYPWNFSLDFRQLSKLTTPPPEAEEFRFENAFVVPAESLRIIRTNDPSDDYIIVGDNLLSNNDEVFVEMQIDPEEGDLPVYFRNALEFELAARLAMALTDDQSKYQVFQQKADVELARAKNIDAQERPVLSPEEAVFQLTNVRR